MAEAARNRRRFSAIASRSLASIRALPLMCVCSRRRPLAVAVVVAAGAPRAPRDLVDVLADLLDRSVEPQAALLCGRDRRVAHDPGFGPRAPLLPDRERTVAPVHP